MVTVMHVRVLAVEMGFLFVLEVESAGLLVN